MQFKITSDECTVVLGLEGAMLNSLKKDGVEYLWQGDEKYWKGQAPVCFPIVGVLRDNKATAFGKKCEMSRHGVARINPFEVVSKYKNSIVFAQNANKNTKKAFPFDYRLEIGYEVIGNTIENTYRIINIGEEKFPFVIGGHPAFCCPLKKNEKFEDYKVVFDRVIQKAPLRPDHNTGLIDINKRFDVLDGDTLKLKHDLFYDDALIFDNVVSKKATLIGPEGLGISVEYPDMSNLLVWSAENDAPFVALEPWSGISTCSDESDELENRRGMLCLLPNETATYRFKITLI